MPANAIQSHGTQVTVDGALVGGSREPSISGVEVNTIDSTAHDSGGWKTYIGGLKDGGSIELSGNADPADVGQVKLISEIGETVPVVMTLTNGRTISCNAIVGGYNVGAGGDDVVSFSCSLKISGAVTHAGGA
jgi:predicted secreted protein